MDNVKTENWFDKTLHFFVHNGFLITAADMCITHAFLMLIYFYADIGSMYIFNTVSVIVYLFCVLLCIYGKPMPVYLSIILEVTAYSVYGVKQVGWYSGTAYFLCAIVPVTLYFGYLLLGKYRRPIIAALLSINFATYVSLYLKYNQYTPPYTVPHDLNECLVVLASFTMVFSTVFYNSVYIFSMKLKNEKLKSDNKQLKDEANRDGLTKWLNRTGFFPLALEELKKNDQPLTIAFIDIDNFKRINDSYGHDCGDEVLVHVTKLIKNVLGKKGIYCRWGGEELVLALKAQNLDEATQTMDTVRRIVNETDTIFYNKHINVTVSIGVAEYDRKEINTLPVKDHLETVITLADQRMYKGKQNGKNIVVNE